MGSLTNSAENALINHIFRSAYTRPSPLVYLCLCTADPTDTAAHGSMGEVSGGNYTRKAITFGAPGDGGTGRRVVQSGAVQFDTADASWGNVTHWAIASSNGNESILAHGAFSQAFNIVSGNTPTVSSGVYVELHNSTDASWGFTDTCMDEMLNMFFRNSNTIGLPGVYAALSTANISVSANTANEPSGGGYARYDASTAASWTNATGGTTSNTDPFTFTPSASWGSVRAMGLFTAATSGTLLMYDNENVVNQTVGDSDTVVINAGAFKVSILD